MLIDNEVMDGPAAFSTGSTANRQEVCVLGDVVDERSPPVDGGEVIVSLDREVAGGQAARPGRGVIRVDRR